MPDPQTPYPGLASASSRKGKGKGKGKSNVLRKTHREATPPLSPSPPPVHVTSSEDEGGDKGEQEEGHPEKSDDEHPTPQTGHIRRETGEKREDLLRKVDKQTGIVLTELCKFHIGNTYLTLMLNMLYLRYTGANTKLIYDSLRLAKVDIRKNKDDTRENRELIKLVDDKVEVSELYSFTCLTII